MRTISVFKNGGNRAVRLPRDMDFGDVTELEIRREGDAIILRPAKPSWESFGVLGKADADFLSERPDVIEEGRFSL
ncbi:MAG: type II toxin-antitoxin system VapB family antitoxin [Proteobacteria bacterium]|nr:type II toxin-antitoxin system VapB family antitoxin [Pseudomonadota bacterium]MCL2308551.1 type II toxin-antitoxin system VapB family antitoxin [Pseudomonadota bacterium]